MLRSLPIVLALGLATLAMGCAPMPTLCGRGIKLGHPTMTAEEISFGAEGQVRAVSEGATGGLGGTNIASAK